jgi:hypothetical protein
MIKQKYKVQSIEKSDTTDWILNKHYAKRLPLIEYAFGLFEGKLLHGIVTFGTPSSTTVRQSFGCEFKLMELNRLCVNENIDKNALSFFVSQSLKRLPKPLIIVSYADTAQNHHGYIYQATNWIYTGLSAKRTDWKIKGLEHLHGATIADISRGVENRAEFMKQKFGDDFYLKDRSRKHRYFYFIGSKKQRAEMLIALPYKTEPYPKGDNLRYNADYKPLINGRLF